MEKITQMKKIVQMKNRISILSLKWGILALVLCFQLSGSVPVYADEPIVQINDLINESSEYDGKVVRVKGEALLEALERKDYDWVNINDGTNAIGIVLPKKEVQKITFYGDYKTKGDQIEIEAEFHRSCIEHGGDMDLHFVKMISVEKGEKIKREVEPIRIGIALAATVTAVLSLICFFKSR